MDTVILTTIVALLLCVSCIGVLVLNHIKHLGSDVKRIQEDQALPRIEEESRRLASAVTLLAESSPIFDSPVARLTFQQSLDPSLFAEASEGAALAGLSQRLEYYAADGLQLTLHGVRLTQQGAEMIVSASASGQMLFEKGLVKYSMHRETGKRLPLLDSLRDAPLSEIEAAWDLEIEKRVAAYDRGELEAFSAENVFAEARRLAR